MRSRRAPTLACHRVILHNHVKVRFLECQLTFFGRFFKRTQSPANAPTKKLHNHSGSPACFALVDVCFCTSLYLGHYHVPRALSCTSATIMQGCSIFRFCGMCLSRYLYHSYELRGGRESWLYIRLYCSGRGGRDDVVPGGCTAECAEEIIVPLNVEKRQCGTAWVYISGHGARNNVVQHGCTAQRRVGEARRYSMGAQLRVYSLSKKPMTQEFRRLGAVLGAARDRSELFAGSSDSSPLLGGPGTTGTSGQLLRERASLQNAHAAVSPNPTCRVSAQRL